VTSTARKSSAEKENQKERITEFIGMVRDQAELSGVLETLYKLHLTLVSVEMLEIETSGETIGNP